MVPSNFFFVENHALQSDSNSSLLIFQFYSHFIKLLKSQNQNKRVSDKAFHFMSHSSNPSTESLTLHRSTSVSPVHFIGQQEGTTSTYMNRQFNTGSITLWVSEDLFYIQPRYSSNFIPTVLKINRKTHFIEQIPSEEFANNLKRQEENRKERMLELQKKYTPIEKLHFSILIGLFNLTETYQRGRKTQPLKKQYSKLSQQQRNSKNKYVIMLGEIVQLVCTINMRNIYKIKKTVFIFFNPHHKNSVQQSEANFLFNLGLFFQQGMYYSYSYNLTVPLESAEKLNKKETSKYYSPSSSPNDATLPQQALSFNEDSKTLFLVQSKLNFNWAQVLQLQLLKYHRKWRVPVIQGFVNKMQVYVNAEKFKIILISRRNVKNGGPLQHFVGFTKLYPFQLRNQDPSVANYVQTQQIFHIKDLYFSFIQVRGTAPLHWQYKYSYGVPSGLLITQTIENNYRDFLRHIKQIKESNGFTRVFLLNLLQKNSPIQAKLIQNYQYLIKKSQRQPGLLYAYFDLCNNCSNKNYRQFNRFISNELSNALHYYSFNVFKHSNNGYLQKINTQTGVFRTNCATCIDRTNIAQSRIAAFQIVKMLKSVNIKLTDFNEDLEFIEQDTPFARLYRALWADNGDAISQQYSGTVSTQSTLMRSGKISYMTTIDHGLTSLIRAFRNLRSSDIGKSQVVAYLLSKSQKQ